MATQIGGGFLSGIAQEAYITGFYGILYALGISTGFILLGLGVAGRLQALQIKTTAEVFETVYGSPLLKKLASLLFTASLWGLFVAQIIAFKTITSGLGIHNELVNAFFWLSIIGHTVLGGFAAVVNIDVIKQLFIIIMFLGIFIYSLFYYPLSFSFTSIQPLFISPSATFQELLPIYLMPSLFCLIEQDLAQCFFAARSKATAATAAIFASIFLIFFSLAPVYFGMQTRLLNFPVEGIANPLIVFLAHTCNSLIFALAILALVAAITSTANSLLCAVSSHIMHDFNLHKTTKKNGVYKAQGITLLVGLAGFVASHFMTPTIIGTITLSYELSVGCLFIPLVAAYFFPLEKTRAAGLSMIFGFLGFFIFRIVPLPIAKELAMLGASLLGFLLGLAL